MYTKGDWKIERLPITGGLAIYANGELVAGGLTEANAHLLVQAPKLYEACKFALLLLQDGGINSAEKALRKAIAPVETK